MATKTNNGWRCLIPDGLRNCNGHDCEHCGFDVRENARRQELLKRNGLTNNKHVRLLKITEVET